MLSERHEGHRIGWRPRLGPGSVQYSAAPLQPAPSRRLAAGCGFLGRLPFWPACSQHPGTAFTVALAWATAVLLTASWGISYHDDLTYPRLTSSALRDRLWTLVLTFVSGVSVPFLVMATLVSVYYRLARPINFIIGGMGVSLVANLVALVANVVVHVAANEKSRYVCYRSGVSDSTCAYSVADEIYCGTKLQQLCTLMLLGFDGTMCCLGGLLLILGCTMVHAYRQRTQMKQHVVRAQEADFDLMLHLNARDDVDT